MKTGTQSRQRWVIHLLAIFALVLSIFSGSATRAAAQDYSPVIKAWVGSSAIDGYGWPFMAEVTVSVDDPATAQSPDYTENITADGWGNFQAHPWSRNFRLAAGQKITMTNGTYTREHFIMKIVVTSADIDTDIVTGTADPNQPVMVCMRVNGCIMRRTSADGNGNWSVDFRIAGSNADEAAYDIRPGDSLDAAVYEADGDGTGYDYWVPLPSFSVRLVDNEVHGYQWPLGASVTLTVDDPNIPGPVDYTDTQNAVQANWDPSQTWVRFDIGGDFVLKAGQVVTMTSGTTVKTHTVTSLVVTGVDPVADTVYGTAVAGSIVDVGGLCGPNGCANRRAAASADGSWLVDFQNPGPNPGEESTFDIVPGTGSEARQGDEDGDNTQFSWYVMNPYIEASPSGHWVHVREWPKSTQLTMTLTGPGVPGGSYTDTATMGQAPWNPGDPNDIVANFAIPNEIQIQANQVITVTDGAKSKSLTVSDLRVTGFDLEADTVSGVGTAGLSTQVCANAPGTCFTRWAMLNPSGSWVVNYSTPGTAQDEQNTYDLVPGSDGWAAQYDAEGDRTWYDWRVPNPNFTVRPENNQIEGWDWPLGATVMLSASHPSGGSYTTSQVVGVSPWNANQTYVNFNLGGSFDIQAGDDIALSDGATSRTYTVIGLTVSKVDMDADTVSGSAEAGSPVDVWSCNNNEGCANRHVTARPDGTWTAEFAHPGPGNDEWQVMDLVSGVNGGASQTNGQGNRTQVDWHVFSPRIDASYEFDWIQIHDFTPGGQVTYSIYDRPFGDPQNPPHLLFSPVTGPVDPYGDGWVDSGLTHTDLVPGYVVEAVDETTHTTRQLTIRKLVFERMDKAGRAASGKSEAGVTFNLNIGAYDYSVLNTQVTADGNGDWSVDLGALGYQSEDYYWANVSLCDAESNCVNADSPWINASADSDWANASNFSKNADITLEVFRVDGGARVLGPVTLHTNRSGQAWTNFRDYGFDLELGDSVVYTDVLGWQKELTVQFVQFDEIDPVHDTASGRTLPNRRVDMNINSLFSNWGDNPQANSSGNWSSNFGLRGYDLTEAMWGSARLRDGDGDFSEDSVTMSPGMSASPVQDWVSGYNFTPAGEVRLQIYAAESGDLIKDLTFTADNNSNIWINSDQHQIDLLPGMYVVLTDVATDKQAQMTLANLTFDNVDYEANIATGHAEAGKQVVVQAGRNFENYEISIIAGAGGIWTADFGARGIDLTQDMWLNARVYDAGGNSTQVDGPRPPQMTVSVNSNWISGNNWSPDSGITITVNPQAETGYQSGLKVSALLLPVAQLQTVTVTAHTDRYGNFWINLNDFGIRLEAGDTVQASDPVSGLVKSQVLAAIAITQVDCDHDIVRGTAPADTRLTIGIGSGSNYLEFDVFSESDGTWEADLAAHDFDLTWAMDGNVRIADEDGDVTQLGFKAPGFSVWYEEDSVEGWGWKLGETVTLTIDDPETEVSPDYTDSGVVSPAPWDPSGISVRFNTNTEGQANRIDIQPGFTVTLSGGGYTKTLMVVNLTVDSVDPINDTISGTAPEGAVINSWICDNNGCVARHDTAGFDGRWISNYATPGDEVDDVGTYDLQNGTSGEANINDEDGDNTRVHWSVSPECAPGDSVSGQVLLLNGAPVNGAQIQFEDYDTGKVVALAHTDETGGYSCRLPDGDYRIWAKNNDYAREYFGSADFQAATKVTVVDGAGLGDVNLTLKTPMFTFDHLTFNMVRPITSDLRVRQAIAYGTNRLRIIAKTYPQSPLMDSYVGPDNWAYAASGLPQYGYDPAKAEALLTEAGWVDTNHDGVREKGDLRLHLKYYTTDTAIRQTLFDLFKENMAQIGVEVSLHALPSGQLFASDGPLYGTHDFDIAEFGWMNDPNEPGFAGDMYRTGSVNPGSYSNLTADQYLDLAAEQPNRAEQIPYLQQHQIAVMNDLAVLPLFQRITMTDQDKDGLNAFVDACPGQAANTCDAGGSAAWVVTKENGGSIQTPNGNIKVEISSGSLSAYSVTMTITGQGSADLSTDHGRMHALYSAAIEPGGNMLESPAWLTFRWPDADKDGIVDGTEISEKDLYLSKDGVVIAGPCGSDPSCNLDNNYIQVQASGMGAFAIGPITNTGPSGVSITAPFDPQRQGAPVNVNGTFTDPDPGDMHTAVWTWGDGSTSQGVVTDRTVTGSHTYTEAGVYTVTLQVMDAAGETSSAVYQYVVVYDPSAGFVTGGGWILSPAGAYAADPTLAGKATFGFVSKYKKGASVPTGNTEFSFHIAGFTFKSDTYDWLVIAGAKAQFKGTGTINGQGAYGFILTAIDGQISGGGGMDRFRIKIWNKATGAVVYDNQYGAADTDAPVSGLGGGSISIQKDK